MDAQLLSGAAGPSARRTLGRQARAPTNILLRSERMITLMKAPYAMKKTAASAHAHHGLPTTLSRTRYTFTPITVAAKPQQSACHLLLSANWPMNSVSEQKCRTGSKANGSCTDCRMFNHWFTVLFRFGWSAVARATTTAGPRAMLLVINVRNQMGTFHSKKPSMTYWPAKVPVMVDAWPAASTPRAKSFSPSLPFFPRSNSKESPPWSKPISPQNPRRPSPEVHSVQSLPVQATPGTHARGPSSALAQSSTKKPLAKEVSKAALMRKEMKSATALSSMLYLLA
mmetsp:Transcript_28627/g.75760  ORF Transcript_28627/g.75760 Transcript_28627/m.75760 type:complete len:284 (-) Transcript_28627:900-1751(-)